jgi:hypothetical protein
MRIEVTTDSGSAITKNIIFKRGETVDIIVPRKVFCINVVIILMKFT